MWDWNKTAKAVQNFLNTDETVKKFVDEARQTAIKENWSEEKWTEYKNTFAKIVFLRAVQSNPYLMKEFGKQVYKELRGEI